MYYPDTLFIHDIYNGYFSEKEGNCKINYVFEKVLEIDDEEKLNNVYTLCKLEEKQLITKQQYLNRDTQKLFINKGDYIIIQKPIYETTSFEFGYMELGRYYNCCLYRCISTDKLNEKVKEITKKRMETINKNKALAKKLTFVKHITGDYIILDKHKLIEFINKELMNNKATLIKGYRSVYVD